MRHIVLCLLTACSIPSPPEPGREYTVAVDVRYTPEERAEIQGALDTWHAASGGLIRIRMVDSDGDTTLHRERTCGSHRITGEVWANPDAMAAEGWDVGGLRRCILHNVGSLYGFRVGMESELTDGDVEACRSAGFCSP